MPSGLDHESELDGEFLGAAADIDITVTPYSRFVGENDERVNSFNKS